MSVAESCSPTLHIDHVAWRSLRYLVYLSLQCRCQKRRTKMERFRGMIPSQRSGA